MKAAPGIERRGFNAWLARRIPPSTRITLSQVNIFIFPTRSGFIFGVLLLTLLVGAINYQNSLVYALVFMLSSIFLITILHTFRNLSGLSLEVCEVRSGFVGEDIEFSVRVERSKGEGREGIEIGWPGGYKQSVELFDEQATTVRLYLNAHARGWLIPGRLLVETCYPLGLLRAWTWVDLKAQGLIFPKPIFDQSHNSTLSGQRDDGVLVDPLGSDDFVDLREYVPGDPIKNILWPTYARTGELAVKRYASYLEPRLWFDFAELPGDAEEKLSRLAGLAISATQSEREFGARLPQLEIAPGIGEMHLNAFLRELALYDHPR